MTLRPETIALIFGTVLGASLTFVFSQLEKCLERKTGKKKAIMCLRIELRQIKSLVDALARTQSTLGPSIPSSDILELDMTTQAPQFMHYEEGLAEKIYDLSTCLRSANRHRQVASGLLSNQSNATFQSNAQIFVQELKKAQRVLNEIDNAIHFEQGVQTTQ